MADNSRTSLFWKVGAYYGLCFAVLIGIGLNFPEWLKFLPFGGLEALDHRFVPGQGGDLVEQMFEPNPPTALFNDAMNLLSALVGCLIVMLPMRRIYLSGAVATPQHGQVASGLLLVPMVVAAIVYIVKFSLPLAFALAGIFAGIRYRVRLKSQADAHFTFACIAVGLAAGTRSLGIGLLLGAFFSFAVLAASPKGGGDAED